jgi:hypothetical protein
MLCVQLHETLNEHLPEPEDGGDDVAAALTELAREAIDKVLKKPLPAFLARVDLVADGPTAQMTPLLAPEGVIIRLDLGVRDFCFSADIEEQREHLRTVLYHEFYHLRDRLDPEFQLDYHEDSTGDREKRRLPINAVWDVSIERRKLDTFNLAPFAWFSRTKLSHREAVLANLQSLYGTDHVVEELFVELWDTRRGHATHPELIAFADRLPRKPPLVARCSCEPPCRRRSRSEAQRRCAVSG